AAGPSAENPRWFDPAARRTTETAETRGNADMPDRAAIVTGGSSGIGLAIARMLGREGHGLTVAARRPDKLEAAVEGLRGEGFQGESVAGNLGDEDVIKQV